MRVVQAATLAHAVVTWYDATKHKPLSKATLFKATAASAAWGSLHSANLNDTPMIKVDWSCLSSYFRGFILKFQDQHTHTQCGTSYLRHTEGAFAQAVCKLRFGEVPKGRWHDFVALWPLRPRWSLMSDTCTGWRANLQHGTNPSASPAPTEAGIIWTCICVAGFNGLRLSQKFIQVAHADRL